MYIQQETINDIQDALQEIYILSKAHKIENEKDFVLKFGKELKSNFGLSSINYYEVVDEIGEHTTIQITIDYLNISFTLADLEDILIFEDRAEKLQVEYRINQIKTKK
jgi:acyl carrier protein